MFCQRCGTEIMDESQKFCQNCGMMLGTGGKEENQMGKMVSSKIKEFVGGERKIDLHLRDIFSSVFKHHTIEEAEELFVCGTSKTTPKESEILEEWPKPWVYSRVLILMLMVYFALTLMWKSMHNEFALMNIPWIGTLIGPITILIFFFEVNVPRNISIIKTIKVFFAGGAASLLFTLMLYAIAPNYDISTISGVIVVGIVEEIGKLGICALLISKHKGKLYLLNGILYGGAVGAGFAVFESIGYSVRIGISNGCQAAWGAQNMEIFNEYFYSSMLANVKLRGFLSPGAHIAWAAVEGFAIIVALQGAKFTWETLVQTKFLKIVWIPIALHAFWDSSLLNQIKNWKFAALVGIIWIIILVFISRGLREIEEIRKKA